jgi:hypothetical protein
MRASRTYGKGSTAVHPYPSAIGSSGWKPDIHNGFLCKLNDCLAALLLAQTTSFPLCNRRMCLSTGQKRVSSLDYDPRSYR